LVKIKGKEREGGRGEKLEIGKRNDMGEREAKK
jgi:hypothetical protein